MKKLNTAAWQRIAECLQRRPDIVAAYGFGSQVRGGNPSPRDVDVAVLGTSRLTLDQLLGLRSELSLALGTDRLDLVDLRAAGPVMKRNVVAGDMRFFCRDDHAANEYELRCLGEYRDSAHRRQLQTQSLREEYVRP